MPRCGPVARVTVRGSAVELTSLGELFILVLAPFFGRLGLRLGVRSRNQKKTASSAYELILAGVALLILVWSAAIRKRTTSGTPGGPCSYVVLEVGDLRLSPICLSTVTELSVQLEVGFMMGGRFLGTADSEVLAAPLGKLSAIEVPEGEV